MQASEIREAYKLSAIPGLIAFSGGAPDPTTFPVEELKKSAVRVFDQYGPMAIQYFMTEGSPELREWIVEHMKKTRNINVPVEEVAIIDGGQQGLDFTSKIFINEGDILLCENPTYQGALNAFKAYNPTFMGVETDDDGVVPEALSEVLTKNDVRLIYVNPDFQNPTGRRWTLERRQAFMDVVKDFDVVVLEDDPYGDLAYDGSMMPPLKSYDEKGQIIYLSSFSKIVAPGFRVAWVSAAPEILEKYIFAKQAADLQASTVCQLIIADFLKNNSLDDHLKLVRKVYERKGGVMIDAIRKEFPDSVKVNTPKGGLFLWGEMPQGIDTLEVLRKCAENKVAFINGRAFFPETGHDNCFRLSFSAAPEDQIPEGIKRMAEVIKTFV
jgi:2-aminoadipate transaminase